MKLDITVKPRTILHEGKKFVILDVKEKSFIIEGIDIVLDEEEKIKKVLIGKKHHPNAVDENNVASPPQDASENTEWCLPLHLRNQPYNSNIAKKIVELIKVWNYNDCYWKTWDTDFIYYVESKEVEERMRVPKSVVDYIVSDKPSTSNKVRLKMRQVWLSLFDGMFNTGESLLKYLRESKSRM